MLFIMIIFFILLLLFDSSISFRKACPGDEYNVNHQNKTIPKHLKVEQGFHPYFIKHNIMQEMFDLLKNIVQIFEQNNIEYWLHCGTLLGYMRHGGFIPWDDDIDLGLLISQVPKLNQISWDSLGFKLKKNKDLWKIRRQNKKFPFVDIVLFVDKEEDSQKLEICFPIQEDTLFCERDVAKKLPNEIYDKKDLFPLKKVKFENTLDVFIPAQPEKCIEQIYGKEALNTISGKKNIIPWFFSHKTEATVLPWRY